MTLQVLVQGNEAGWGGVKQGDHFRVSKLHIRRMDERGDGLVLELREVQVESHEVNREKVSVTPMGLPKKVRNYRRRGEGQVKA